MDVTSQNSLLVHEVNTVQGNKKLSLYKVTLEFTVTLVPAVVADY